MLTLEEKKIRAAEVVRALEEKYPDATCALKYEGDPWRLLVMGRLSAQCTDAVDVKLPVVHLNPSSLYDESPFM